jgi:hypothetical protein
MQASCHPVLDPSNVKPDIAEKHLQTLETPVSYGPNTAGMQYVALLPSPVPEFENWSGWDGVGTAAVTLVGSIAYFTRVRQYCDPKDSSTITRF